MKEFVIIEKLKETIGDRKVAAAVFYTFNLDCKFFENYILTTFLPHVNFSDHEIQNTILWRRYAAELPDVTVYCDFHAKGPEAPNLSYIVRAIDMPTVNGTKPCFHPKVSFILLDDWTLILLVGSNNLTVGGWCTNKEIITIIELKNGAFFPYEQKHQLWNFLKEINKFQGSEFSPAEEKLNKFFYQRLHTDASDFTFHSTLKTTVYALLEGILEKNNEEKFKKIEIISPYISPGTHIISELQQYVEKIRIDVPYQAFNEANLTDKCYHSFLQAGVEWSRLKTPDNSKAFRFNHSKIYRLKGEQHMYTIIGSVNFTDTAWKGSGYKGNIESSIIFEESSENWQDWLETYHNPEIVFAEEPKDETTRIERTDAPDFQFELNWIEQTLRYKNLVKNKFNGKIVFNAGNKKLRTGAVTVPLSQTELDELASNPVIRIRQYHTQKELYYYPMQIGIESKPLPADLRLKDGELLSLWERVSLKKEAKSEISDLIERFISARLDKEGEVKLDNQHVKSSLNLIASHLSALINLESKLFETPRLKRDFLRAGELLDYYLFNSNIDTLYGYQDLLKAMYEEHEIMPGVYWFLINLLKVNFYNLGKIRKYYKTIDKSDIVLKLKVNHALNSTDSILKELTASLKKEDVDMKLLHWVKNNIQ